MPEFKIQRNGLLTSTLLHVYKKCTLFIQIPIAGYSAFPQKEPGDTSGFIMISKSNIVKAIGENKLVCVDMFVITNLPMQMPDQIFITRLYNYNPNRKLNKTV